MNNRVNWKLEYEIRLWIYRQEKEKNAAPSGDTPPSAESRLERIQRYLNEMEDSP